jgi:hypothetical protein
LLPAGCFVTLLGRLSPTPGWRDQHWRAGQPQEVHCVPVLVSFLELAVLIGAERDDLHQDFLAARAQQDTPGPLGPARQHPRARPATAWPDGRGGLPVKG